MYIVQNTNNDKEQVSAPREYLLLQIKLGGAPLITSFK